MGSHGIWQFSMDNPSRYQTPNIEGICAMFLPIKLQDCYSQKGSFEWYFTTTEFSDNITHELYLHQMY